MTSVRRTTSAGIDYVKSLWARREFAWYMAMGNLKSRNASTALGLLWWILNPLLQGAVYFVVFGLILNVSRDLGYLLAGVFVFYFTSTSMTSGANSIVQNRQLLVNLQFPRLIMPITAVVEAGVGFLVSIPALYLIIGPIDGVWPSVSIIVLPLAFGLHLVFNLGLAALVARITVPFRDMNNLIRHVTRIWFYLSPILYTTDRFDDLPRWAEVVYNLNPMVSILSLYRTALLGYPFSADAALSAAVWAGVVFTFAVASFIRYEGKMARYL